MNGFQEGRYFELFQKRLSKATTEDELLELIQELQHIRPSMNMTELERMAQVKLNCLVNRRGETDEEEVEKSIVSGNDEVSAPYPNMDMLQIQKLKLLQLENLLAEVEVEPSNSSYPSKPNLILKKRILFKTANHPNATTENKEEYENELAFRQDRIEQDKLSDLLAEKANQLKENSQTLAQKLISDSSNLVNLEGKLLDNAEKIVKERFTMKKISSGTWKTTIMIWGAILIGILLFLWIFFYMRLVSPVKVRAVVKKTETTNTATAATPASTKSSYDNPHFDYEL